ncbi:hypothetical protein KI387_012232, partial [Taxus chinensis]
MSPFVSRGRTVAPAMSLFSESPRTAQTGQFQSPQLARTAIGWSQSPQQRNGGLSLLANAGQAHSSFTRDRRTPPSRRDRLSLLSAKEMAGNWLSLLHAPLGTQQRNGTPTRWTGKFCTLLHAGLATFSLHAPPSTRQHFLQRDRHTETAPPSTRQAHYMQQQKRFTSLRDRHAPTNNVHALFFSATHSRTSYSSHGSSFMDNHALIPMMDAQEE